VPPLDASAKFIFLILQVIDDSVFADLILASDTIIPPRSSNPCLKVPSDLCVEQGTYIFDEILPQGPGGYTVAYQVVAVMLQF